MSDIPKAVADAADGRDERKCRRCGVYLDNNGSRHHRQRRRVGGHVVENIILLCGSGTTGCHGWVHANPLYARAMGMIVPTWFDDVAVIPVRTFTGWALFHRDGGQTFIPEAEAFELLAMFDLLAKAGD